MSDDISLLDNTPEEVQQTDTPEPVPMPPSKGCRCARAKKIRDTLDKAKAVQSDSNKPE